MFVCIFINVYLNICIYQDFNPYPIWGRDYDMVQFSLERLLTQQANEMGFWRLGKLSPPKNQEDTSVRWVLTSQQKMVFSNDLVLLSCWFSTFFWDSFWTNLKPSYWFFWPNLYEMWWRVVLRPPHSFDGFPVSDGEWCAKRPKGGRQHLRITG